MQGSPSMRDDRDAAPAWQLMFADLIALLLTFFVMLFAMNTIDLGKWNNVVATISTKPVQEGRGAASAVGAERNLAAMSNRFASQLDYLAGVLRAQLAAEPTLASSMLLRLEDRLILSLPADLLFDSGRAELRPRAKEALFALAGALRHIGNQVDVQGHADPNPIRGGAFASNWDLSLSRAAAVADSLRGAGYARDLGVFGHGDGRIADVAEIEPIERRYQLARRVDIVVRPVRSASRRIDP